MITCDLLIAYLGWYDCREVRCNLLAGHPDRYHRGEARPGPLPLRFNTDFRGRWHEVPGYGKAGG